MAKPKLTAKDIKKLLEKINVYLRKAEELIRRAIEKKDLEKIEKSL